MIYIIIALLVLQQVEENVVFILILYCNLITVLVILADHGASLDQKKCSWVFYFTLPSLLLQILLADNCVQAKKKMFKSFQ